MNSSQIPEIPPDKRVLRRAAGTGIIKTWQESSIIKSFTFYQDPENINLAENINMFLRMF